MSKPEISMVATANPTISSAGMPYASGPFLYARYAQMASRWPAWPLKKIYLQANMLKNT
jgi:hypothetical protein